MCFHISYHRNTQERVEMKVMYTCDNNYVWLMGISTISLFENNKEIEDLKVYLLGENISEDNKNELKKIGAFL